MVWDGHTPRVQAAPALENAQLPLPCESNLLLDRWPQFKSFHLRLQVTQDWNKTAKSAPKMGTAGAKARFLGLGTLPCHMFPMELLSPMPGSVEG